ncbi:MAG: hypothetical protein KAY32_16500 [Candidatus Eisenbacteria sp.]|nr:hypothetical protein [Candidatus Eisenbacteria bacterium]
MRSEKLRAIAGGRYAVACACLVLLGLLMPAVSQAERLTPQEEAAWIATLRAEIAARGATFQIAANSLTKIPWEDFQQRYLGLRIPEGIESHPIIDDHGINDRDLPSHWDWREHAGVPGMRHQGACGSCWCFSAAVAFESAIMIAEGFEVDISEQYALVCNLGGSSCSGGWMWDAYEVWQDYGAIAEEDMPYEADDTIPCPGSTYPPIAAAGTVHDVDYTVSAIKQAIYDHGIISATVMVYPDLVPYEGGCYTHDCPGQSNHAIGLVGWDDDYCDGQGAWIMKNSWGDDWGMGGYAYIRYDAACIGQNGTYVDYVPIANLLGINHEPLENTVDSTSPYEVVAEIISTGGSVDLAESYLAYRINNQTWAQVVLIPSASPNEYLADIPAQPTGTKVEYYLHAEDTVDNEKTVPIWAPEESYVFIVGDLELILCEDYEQDSGWTVGAAGDDATSGIWERVDPQGTYNDGGYMVQPEDDHTESPGVLCFVTGGQAGSSVGDHDVDGGKTTLLSPIYDFSEYELILLDYRRWYTNRRGSSPYNDIWEVSARSGESDWAPIEYTSICRENWSHQIHILNDFVELGPEVQFRFVASDEGDGSLVEAALDDFLIKGIRRGASAIHEVTPILAGPLLRAAPNPFQSEIAFSFRLAERGPVVLRVHDCAGRLIRVLQASAMAPGRQRVVWDGRDGAGQSVPSGVYMARLIADGVSHQMSMMLIR